MSASADDERKQPKGGDFDAATLPLLAGDEPTVAAAVPVAALDSKPAAEAVPAIPSADAGSGSAGDGHAERQLQPAAEADEQHDDMLDVGQSPYGTPLVAPIADQPQGSRKERLRLFLSGVKFSLFVSHALSSWGDRMWTFAIGLFLADLMPGSLRLIAAYGFSRCGAVMLLGPVLGDWVDRRPRLYVARTALVVQNTSVVLCGCFLAIVYSARATVYDEPWKQSLWEVAVIFVAIVSILASNAMKLAVEKDWVSVICEGDGGALADMNATLRGIDQAILIMAPMATGLIMTVGSMLSGALFIVAWNVASVFAEFLLLYRVYKKVPALASKKKFKQEERKQDAEAAEPMMKDAGTAGAEKEADDEGGCKWLCMKMLTPFFTLRRGWAAYMSNEVKYAGLGLAFIYLTVLSFDNVFTGFVYSQGLSQLYISIGLGMGAMCAIVATFAYPRLRKRLGVETTGLIGFTAEAAVLTLCVASVWLPGSPFSLTPLLFAAPQTYAASSSMPSNVSAVGASTAWTSTATSTMLLQSSPAANQSFPEGASVHATVASTTSPAKDMTSVAFLLAGAILARFGVWTADLAVNQLLLERVDKSQRGVINGVQVALNTFMSMFEFIMVIAAPAPHTFGALVIVSFVCVATGDLFFIIYCRRVRGYVLCN